MKKPSPLVKNISTPTLFWLFAAIMLVVMPHATRLPLLVTALFLTFLSWRYLIAVYGWQPISRILRFVLAALAVAVVYLGHGSILGRDAGVSLLVAMLGVKFLEMYNQRDMYISIVIAYFLIITHFLYSQSLVTAAYMVGVLWVITASLIDLNRHHRAGNKLVPQNLRIAAVLLVQALPITVLLFIVFPRLGSPLWGLPDDAYGGQTGLSDSMSPGNISRLTLSDEIAFRVEFEGKPPLSENRYWRGPVFWYTDGESWRPGAMANQTPVRQYGLAYEPRGEAKRYTVTVEPHNHPWLYVLDLPAEHPSGTFITNDYQLHSETPVNQRRRYSAASYLAYRTPALSESERERALQLPPGADPRTVGLGQSWRAEHTTDEGRVGAALSHFNLQPFVYTLSPPLLPDMNPTDAFLFDTQRGFCEHYSAAFVILMRAAGVPARVVTGYQGGEMNPLGDYMIVRQRDAHAWAEVWIEGKGWSRFDPTAAVAPERVERSIDPDSLGADAVRFRLARTGVAGAVIDHLWQSWDSVNNYWNRFVIQYSDRQQMRLLQDLGFDVKGWQDLVTLLAGGLFLLLGSFAAVLMLRARSSMDPVARLWQTFCSKMRRAGIQRAPQEGPRDFTARAAAHRLDAADAVRRIGQLYIQLRYSEQPSQEDLKTFRRAIRAFRI